MHQERVNKVLDLMAQKNLTQMIYPIRRPYSI